MFTLFLVVLGLQATQASQLADAVSVSNAVVTRGTNGQEAVEFSVFNRSSVAVTAWETAIDVTFADGSTRTWGLEHDGYAEFERARPSAGRFIPANANVSGRVPLGPSNVAVANVRLRLLWFVFADKSSFGDPAAIEQLFNRRDREYRALLLVSGILRAAAKTSDARDGIGRALASLKAPNQDDFDHSVKQQMRRNLQAAHDRHPSITVSPEEFLRHWTTAIEAQLKAAEEHRRPKSR